MTINTLKEVEFLGKSQRYEESLSSMSQLVESYSIFIKKLEHQMVQLSMDINQQKSGTLLSNTIENPSNMRVVWLLALGVEQCYQNPI